MRSRSGDPAYWRQKAAEFRRRALATVDDSRVVLLRRALEFDRIADELDELIGGDRPPAVAIMPVAGSTMRSRLAFAGLASAFAVGCAVGAVAPMMWPVESPPLAAGPVRIAEAPPPPRNATSPVAAVPAQEQPPVQEQMQADVPAPPAPSLKMAAADAERAEPAASAPSETLPAVAATEPASPAAAPAAAQEAAAAPPPTADPPVASSAASAPAEDRDAGAVRPRAPAHVEASAREPDPPRRAREAANERLAQRSRPARASHNSLDLRRELPPPTVAAPVATPTPVVAHATDLMSGPAARETEAGAGAQECRPYTAARTAIGLDRPVRGLACRRPDGRWQLVTEVPDN